MHRQPRLDAPRLVRHVMARGIEGQKLFRDKKGREGFLIRLAESLSLAGGTSAWTAKVAKSKGAELCGSQSLEGSELDMVKMGKVKL